MVNHWQGRRMAQQRAQRKLGNFSVGRRKSQTGGEKSVIIGNAHLFINGFMLVRRQRWDLLLL